MNTVCRFLTKFASLIVGVWVQPAVCTPPVGDSQIKPVLEA